MCTLHGWIYRVILEEAALEGRSRKRGKEKKKEQRKKGRREEEKERITGSFSSGRSEMGFSNWTRENSSVRRRTLDSSCSLFLLSEGRNREREREREASLAAFPDRSVGNRRREKERLINRRKRFR